MHERLFEHQSALDDGSLVEHAIALGLNMPRFLGNLSQHVYTRRVQADLLSGVESGVSGTPTFFINYSLFSFAHTFRKNMSNYSQRNVSRRRLLAVAGLSITSIIALLILERDVTTQHPNSLSTPNSPQSLTMVSFSLNNYQWKNRLLLVFAPSKQNSAYQKQKKLILGHQSQLDDRDLRLVEVFANDKSHVDNQAIDAASAAQLRDRFHVSKDEFCIILVGKDGYEKRRDRAPIELSHIFNQIDQMPMRQQEMREQ